jgi:Ca2+-transporting ATPase
MIESPRKGRRPSVDGSLYFIKGMPEKVLGECMLYLLADGTTELLAEEDRTLALSQARRLAANGLRVLALAFGHTLGELTFAGLVGMEDPPREGVADSIRKLRAGGVRVMMVTGDSKETALAIAQRCGITGKIYERNDSPGLDDLLLTSNLPDDDGDDESDLLELGSSEALSGSEIDNIPPESLADSIAGVRVFYRVVPRHKLSIVRACKCSFVAASRPNIRTRLTTALFFISTVQSQGEIVAMTGDGVNDGKYPYIVLICYDRH